MYILNVIDMKKYILLIIACTLFCISNAQEKNAITPESKNSISKNESTIVFEKAIHDFGVISESKGNVEYSFAFTNTGNLPISVLKVTTDCGCTAPDWSKEPIAPGKKGYIKVSFNPKGYSDDFTKILTVFSDGNPSRVSLRIKGTVE